MLMRDTTQYRLAFAKRLRKAAFERNVKLTELAKRVELSTASIYEYANGKVLPNAMVAAQIALALDIDANWLLGIRRNR